MTSLTSTSLDCFSLLLSKFWSDYFRNILRKLKWLVQIKCRIFTNVECNFLNFDPFTEPQLQKSWWFGKNWEICSFRRFKIQVGEWASNAGWIPSKINHLTTQLEFETFCRNLLIQWAHCNLLHMITLYIVIVSKLWSSSWSRSLRLINLPLRFINLRFIKLRFINLRFINLRFINLPLISFQVDCLVHFQIICRSKSSIKCFLFVAKAWNWVIWVFIKFFKYYLIGHHTVFSGLLPSEGSRRPWPWPWPHILTCSLFSGHLGVSQ